MSGLALPRHVHERIQRDKQNAAVASNIQNTSMNALASDDFVSQASVKDQLAKLFAYINTRREKEPAYALPQPTGWRILVLILTVPETTDAGLHLGNDTLESKALSSPQGVVLGVGPAAYQDKTRFAFSGELTPWVGKGDRIIWKRYDLSLFQIANGQHLGFLNDTQPVATLDSGWLIPV